MKYYSSIKKIFCHLPQCGRPLRVLGEGKQAKDIKKLCFHLYADFYTSNSEKQSVEGWLPGTSGDGGRGHDGDMVLKGTNSQTPNVRCMYSRDLTYITVTITDCMLYSQIVKRVDLKRCNRETAIWGDGGVSLSFPGKHVAVRSPSSHHTVALNRSIPSQ